MVRRKLFAATPHLFACRSIVAFAAAAIFALGTFIGGLVHPGQEEFLHGLEIMTLDPYGMNASTLLNNTIPYPQIVFCPLWKEGKILSINCWKAKGSGFVDHGNQLTVRSHARSRCASLTTEHEINSHSLNRTRASSIRIMCATTTTRTAKTCPTGPTRLAATSTPPTLLEIIRPGAVVCVSMSKCLVTVTLKTAKVREREISVVFVQYH
jgi:hypothetical protein